MSLARIVEAEWLDALSPVDPRAVGSRRDLVRVNAVMGHAHRVTHAVARAHERVPVRQIVDLGAGDGTFLLGVVRRLARRGMRAQAILVDRQPVVTASTQAALGAAGWPTEVQAADARAWLEQTAPDPGTVLVSNLFLHHFDEPHLEGLLREVARVAGLFVACEPRRSRCAWVAAHLVGLLGCGATTRHDAVVSVRAGFADRDLTRRWPAPDAWELDEGPAGLFSHALLATRRRGA